MPKKETPQDRYLKKNAVSVSFRIIKTTEQDILAKLESVPNKAGYIKRLILEDIRKEENTDVL